MMAFYFQNKINKLKKYVSIQYILDSCIELSIVIAIKYHSLSSIVSTGVSIELNMCLMLNKKKITMEVELHLNLTQK